MRANGTIVRGARVVVLRSVKIMLYFACGRSISRKSKSAVSSLFISVCAILQRVGISWKRYPCVYRKKEWIFREIKIKYSCTVQIREMLATPKGRDFFRGVLWSIGLVYGENSFEIKSQRIGNLF